MERNRRGEGDGSFRSNLVEESAEMNSYAGDFAETDRVEVEEHDLYDFRTDELPEKSKKK